MAAVARPPVAGGNSSLKAALEVFVVLTVASLGAFIYLFTLQSDLDQRVSSAEGRASQAQRSTSEAQQALSHFAKEIIGQPTESPADIQKGLDAVRTPLLQDERL